MNLNEGNTRQELKLHKELYPKEAVFRAISAFSHLCTIQIHEDESYLICIGNKFELDPTITMKEFENYLIDSIVHFADLTKENE